LTVLIRCN